jgi:hypothetical protein
MENRLQTLLPNSTCAAKAWSALENAVVRVGPSFVAQAVANTIWGYQTLGRIPGSKAWSALTVAAARVAPGMGLHSFAPRPT